MRSARRRVMRRSRKTERPVPAPVDLRKRAGAWLQEKRKAARLSQIELAQRLGLKYYTFISQVENGFGRVPSDSMEAWARALGIAPPAFARELLAYYEPELHKLLFEVKA